jgi:hypothetical protein
VNQKPEDAIVYITNKNQVFARLCIINKKIDSLSIYICIFWQIMSSSGVTIQSQGRQSNITTDDGIICQKLYFE